MKNNICWEELDLFKQYDKSTFYDLNRQHNIMVLVGNGFDIALLNKYNQGKLKGKTSTYSDFYDYIKYFSLCDDKNILLQRMTKDLEKGKENWSDFEGTIDELLKDANVSVEEIEKCVDDFQMFFTKFLNDLVDSDILLSINTEAKSKKLAMQSLSHFLKDLDETCKINFPQNTYHYDLFSFLFVNFCYTSLLDNYIYLDKGQFDPHKWKTVDRNFDFYPELGTAKNKTVYSTYLVTDVIHPHGTQDVPRSIIFGTDLPDFNKGNSKEKRLIKSYWSRYDVKYKPYFQNVELFIIYGMSISKTDGWWLDQIFDSIINSDSELIIYKYGNETEESIKEKYIEACIRHKDASKEEIEKVKNNIYIVTFKSNDTYFLGLNEKNIDKN